MSDPAKRLLLTMWFTGPVKNGLLDDVGVKGVKYDARGAIAVDENFMTNLDGTSFIVWAIVEERKMAAAGIDKYRRRVSQRRSLSNSMNSS
jgi:glutamate synthase (NADPH/NADH) small chain